MARMPRRSPFAGRHARAGVSFLAVAVIVAATSVSVDLTAPGFPSAAWRGIVGAASHALEFAGVWIALPLGVALVLTAGEPPAWRRWLGAAAAAAAPILVQTSGAARSPFIILLALAAAVTGYALIVFGVAEHRRDASPPGRVPLTVAVLAGANLAVVALGTLHLLLWNPLARVPALDAAQIYLVLGAGRGGVDASPAVWAIGSTVITAAAAVAALVGARRGVVNAHLVVTCGLLLIHATSFFLWGAGIGIGEELAGAFGGPVGDASPVGSLLALAGATCLAAAILIQLLPAAPAEDADEDEDAVGYGAAEQEGPARRADGGVAVAPASVTP
ncbi:MULTISPECIES: hypothetical protein [unclassified Agromyces]|uniref:hypothetical protein n=1 Tax=unclassified Agromyces TaxID=2639701 RepID=UPI003014C1EE